MRKPEFEPGEQHFQIMVGELPFVCPVTNKERKLPVVDIVSEHDRHRLHWFNTMIRFHSHEEDKLYDHIEVKVDKKNALAIQSDHLLNCLMENKFPSTEMPFVDEQTHKWYVGLHSDLGMLAIEAFLEDNDT